jgi:hypothetical protein
MRRIWEWYVANIRRSQMYRKVYSYVGNVKERDHKEYLGIDERIIL